MRAWTIGLLLLLPVLAAQQPPAKPRTAQTAQAPKVDPQRLNELLSGWEKKTKGVRDVECEFQRITRDVLFKTELVEYGKASAIKPYQGRLDLMDEKGKFTQIFIYTGKEIHQYDFATKQETVLVLPDPDPGAGGSLPGPLGFVYGMPASEAKARFDLKLIREFSKDDLEYAEIHATPRTPTDQQEFKLAQLVIDKKTFLPKELRIIEPNGNEQHWIFDRLETNLKPPVKSADIQPFKNLPKDWKKNTNKFGEPANAGDAPKGKGTTTPKTPPEAGRPNAPKR